MKQFCHKQNKFILNCDRLDSTLTSIRSAVAGRQTSNQPRIQEFLSDPHQSWHQQTNNMIRLIRPTARDIGASFLNRRGVPTTVLCRSLATLEYNAHELHDDDSHHSHNNTAHQHCAHSLLILGKPGGGKGTISGKILADFPQFRHVSTGDELRQHVRNQPPLGLEAKKFMDGEFVERRNRVLRTCSF